jgi:hypothetical protein
MKDRYVQLLPTLRAVAREHGYALGLHGSGERDLDLIAVPWTEDASDNETLVEALRVAINGHIANSLTDGKFVGRSPLERPHGRRTWAIRPLENNPTAELYIDLSVMPRVLRLRSGEI